MPKHSGFKVFIECKNDDSKESKSMTKTSSVDGEKNALDSVNIIPFGIGFNSKLTI